jgi:two-component system, chemotaxis family, protein-glutamate methylesterase/glutaminase
LRFGGFALRRGVKFGSQQRISRSSFQLIAIGASAGGLPALSTVLSDIEGDFPGVVVVQHLDPRHKSHLAGLLSKKAKKLVNEAEHGQRIVPGHIYIGPPDEHLLVSRRKIQLAHSRLVRYSRPSIDMMFGSVAAVYGEQAIGVILSGSNRDGADGIAAIKSAGGVTLAQDPATAEFRIMPQAAIDTGCIDLVVPLHDMGKVITELIEKGKPARWPKISH